MGSAFVNDASLGVTSTHHPPSDLSYSQVTEADIKHTIQQLQALAQHWECLLYATGGAINLQKSFWYLLFWTWKKWCALPFNCLKSSWQYLRLTSGSSPSSQIVPHIA